MSDKYTNGDVVDIILDEKLDHAVRDYCDGDSFEDPQTKAYWNQAANALNDLVNHLKRQTGREELDGI